MKKYIIITVVLFVVFVLTAVAVFNAQHSHTYDLTAVSNGESITFWLLEKKQLIKFIDNCSTEYLQNNIENHNVCILSATDEDKIIVNHYSNIYGRITEKWECFRIKNRPITAEDIRFLLNEEELEKFFDVVNIKSGAVQHIAIIDNESTKIPAFLWVKNDNNDYFIIEETNKGLIGLFETLFTLTPLCSYHSYTPEEFERKFIK